jgi:ATP-dependent protease ClpP protease subunit
MDTPNFDSSEIIRLVGHIDEEASENFLSELRETSLTGVEGGLTVVIHSEGGDPEDSMRILDAFQMLKNKGFRIHTIATGKAYSMAAILFCMGDYRTIYPNGRLMFHASRFPELQDYDVTGAKLMDLYNELKVYDDKFFAIMANTGVPANLIEKSRISDVYMDAGEALRYGVVHAIEHEIL